MYSPTHGRFISKDPIGFQAGDVNLYRFVGNDPTNQTDPSGLDQHPFHVYQLPPNERPQGLPPTTGPGVGIPPPPAFSFPDGKLDLGALKSALYSISRSCECRLEADRIAAAIQQTFSKNSRWQPWDVFRWNDERNKSIYCYEWAYGFEDAFNLESSGKCFKAFVEGAKKPGSEDKDGNYKVHMWLAIESVETGKKVYVDDGFAVNGAYVHSQRPIPAGWVYEPGAAADQTRATCHPAQPYNQFGWLNGKRPELESIKPVMPAPASGGAW